MTTIDNDIINEIKSWDDLDISNDLLRGIHSVGYDEPSPIQKKAIPYIINGKDGKQVKILK